MRRRFNRVVGGNHGEYQGCFVSGSDTCFPVNIGREAAKLSRDTIVKLSLIFSDLYSGPCLPAYEGNQILAFGKIQNTNIKLKRTFASHQVSILTMAVDTKAILGMNIFSIVRLGSGYDLCFYHCWRGSLCKFKATFDGMICSARCSPFLTKALVEAELK